jgi:hypothetical protein
VRGEAPEARALSAKAIPAPACSTSSQCAVTTLGRNPRLDSAPPALGDPLPIAGGFSSKGLVSGHEMAEQPPAQHSLLQSTLLDSTLLYPTPLYSTLLYSSKIAHSVFGMGRSLLDGGQGR